VHVRLAPSDGGPRLSNPRRIQYCSTRTTLLVAAVLGCGIACGRSVGAPGLKFEWTLSPAPATVGPVALDLRLLDSAGKAVRGATLRIEAQMSHPGMETAVTPAIERTPGLYHAALQFTMPGDWLLIVSGSLANGEPVRYQINVPRVRPG
jgi:YtkA-like